MPCASAGVLAACADEFRASLADDLNISGALGGLFRLVRETHSALDRGELPDDARDKLRATLDKMDAVLAVLQQDNKR